MSIQGTPITIAGCSVWEYKNTGSGHGSRESASRNRTFIVEWDDFETVLEGVMGKYVNLGGQTVEETAPMAYEEGSILYADSYKNEPMGVPSQDGNGMHVFPYQKLSVDFTPKDLELDDDKDAEDDGEGKWMEESSTSSLQWIQMPRYALRWEGVSGHDGILKEPGGLPVMVTNLTLTRYNVATINRANLVTNAAGTCNEFSFFGWPAECMLYGGYSPRRTINPLGKSSKYTLSVHFKCRIVRKKDGTVCGWNHQFRPGYDWTKVLVNNEKPQFPAFNYRDL